MCDRSGPDTGATLCLTAIGGQDTYLLDKESLFKYEPKRHSEFRKFHRSFNINKPSSAPSTWPFGETVKATFNPMNMGDLLCNMYIRVKLPGLSNVVYNYADKVGKHLFKSITMRVDETVIEIYKDDIGYIYDELYLDHAEHVSREYTDNRFINRVTILSDSLTNIRTSDTFVYVPIPFFFSRRYESSDYETNVHNRPYFPLCAMNKQKLEFDIEFRPQTFFTDEPTDLTLSSFDIVTEEIVVTQEERLFYTSSKYEMITDIFHTHPKSDTEPGNDKFKIELTPQGRVKTLHFFFRNKLFENETIASNVAVSNYSSTDDQKYHYYHNRFNFTPSSSYVKSIDYLEDDIAINAKLTINGEDLPNINNSDSHYYRYLTTLNHKFHGSPRNIYTYSFSMNPRNVDPSGSLDFTNIKNNRTTLECTLNPYHGTDEEFTCHIYYTTYTTLTFENGYLSTRVEPLSYSANIGEYGTGDLMDGGEHVLGRAGGPVMIASFPE
jgi:hypothetical protein